jgi:threonine/homoserine/homoserine lactone efflux protein
MVPLSEEEQRLLEQMEEALAAEDPKFVSALRGVTSRAHSKRVALLAAVAFVVGVALLMTGAVLMMTAVAVAGFVVMLGSAYVALTAWRRLRSPDLPDNVLPITKTRGSSAVPKSSGFMNRMEDRWRRRRDDY